ncbi:chaperone modulator CbpM [Pedobacter boryungensis]|uniref:chaperone modulator CbpM n=1 Tax=Pedobacter boryungensis TaxID=869962 RepID=UPI001C20983A|nr:chaperone modulator CbpM [Pedobacter boryungensis]
MKNSIDKAQRISVEDCCVYYSIETTFVQQLNEQGLIELSRSGKKAFISYEQLPDLERYMRLHYDLEINMAGIETIKHLLNRMQELQQKLKSLQG